MITRPIFGWVDTPLGCVASLGFYRPHKLGPCTMRPYCDSDARVWMGKDVVRTTESDHEQRTFFFLGTPSLKAAGCSVYPMVVIVRCRVVVCILHCCMALGHLQMANIERLANDRFAPGDHVPRAAI